MPMVDNQSQIHTKPPQPQYAALTWPTKNNVILLAGLGHHQFTAYLLLGPKLIKSIMSVNLTAPGAQIVIEVHDIGKGTA